MVRKSGNAVSLSLVGLIIQKTNPGVSRVSRAGQRGRLARVQRWVLLLGALTVSGGILLGVFRVLRIV
jgi:hypothetical protein